MKMLISTNLIERGLIKDQRFHYASKCPLRLKKVENHTPDQKYTLNRKPNIVIDS